MRVLCWLLVLVVHLGLLPGGSMSELEGRDSELDRSLKEICSDQGTVGSGVEISQHGLVLPEESSGSGRSVEVDNLGPLLSPLLSPLPSTVSRDCVPVSLDPSDYQSCEREGFVVVQDEYIAVEFWNREGKPVICCDKSSTADSPSPPSPMPFSFTVIVLTYVGCSLSAIGCALILLTYCIFRDLRSLSSEILMNLAVGYILGDLLILVLEPATVESQNGTFCITLAFMLDFFILIRFSWMSVMALEMVRTFTHACQLSPISAKKAKRKLLILYMLLGWGIPVPLTAVTVVVHFTAKQLLAYRGGVDEEVVIGSCWFERGTAELLAFGIPAGISLFLNAVAFAWIMGNLCWLQIDTKGQRFQCRVQLRVYLAIFCAVGLTWFIVFASPLSVWAFYLFIVFNTTQVFFISLSFVCTKKVFRLYLDIFLTILQPIVTWSYSSTAEPPQEEQVNGDCRGGENECVQELGGLEELGGSGEMPCLTLPREVAAAPVKASSTLGPGHRVKMAWE